MILLVALVSGLGYSAPVVAQAASPDQTQNQSAPRVGEDSPVREAHQAVKKSEAEETLEYRHSATVQWFARLLHIDVETAAKSFEYINFLVVVLAVGIPLIKIVPKVLRKRSEALTEELATARTATADANTRLSAVEAKLAGLDAEINAIRKQVEEEMREDEVRIKSTIGEESARIVAAAEQEIQIAATVAQRGLKQYAADLAIEGALSRLTLNEDTDHALIAEFAGGQAKKEGQS
jgi:F-type H+-transporting ATPase subunit b